MVIPLKDWIKAAWTWSVTDANPRPVHAEGSHPLRVVADDLPDAAAAGDPDAGVQAADLARPERAVDPVDYHHRAGCTVCALLWRLAAGAAGAGGGLLFRVLRVVEPDHGDTGVSRDRGADVGADRHFAGGVGYRSERAAGVLRVFCDIMQTIPIWSFFIPIIVLVGINPVGALVATMVYSVPPMIRVTELALKAVPNELIDFGR